VQPPYDHDVERLLGKLMPPGAGIDPLLLFRVLAIHRDLAERMRPMASGLSTVINSVQLPLEPWAARFP
jgi:hypothetical protein